MLRKELTKINSFLFIKHKANTKCNYLYRNKIYDKIKQIVIWFDRRDYKMSIYDYKVKNINKN